MSRCSICRAEYERKYMSQPTCGDSASLVQRLRKMSAENKAPRDCIDEAADEIERLRKDSDRLEWLMRNLSGKEFRRLGVTYGGNCGRDRIDAAMKC